MHDVCGILVVVVWVTLQPGTKCNYHGCTHQKMISATRCHTDIRDMVYANLRRWYGHVERIGP